MKIDAFCSIVLGLFLESQLFKVSVGKISSTPNACSVLGATITDPNAEEIAAQAKPIGIIGPQIAIRLIMSWSAARSSNEADSTSFNATAKYIIIPTAVANNVPFGIDFLGLLSRLTSLVQLQYQ